MLKISIDIYPGGSVLRKKSIGRIIIVNTGGDIAYGNYTIIVDKKIKNKWVIHFRGKFKNISRKSWIVTLREILNLIPDKESIEEIARYIQDYYDAMDGR